MNSFDALMVTLYLIAIGSAVLFFLGLIADIFWPWLARQWPVRTARPQARYLVRKP
jgi:hypothetical protein